MSGAKVVVSTADGIDMKGSTEMNVVDAAKSAGASLYVPTQSGADYYYSSNGQYLPSVFHQTRRRPSTRQGSWT
jgi:hypothetical protein